MRELVDCALGESQPADDILRDLLTDALADVRQLADWINKAGVPISAQGVYTAPSPSVAPGSVMRSPSAIGWDSVRRHAPRSLPASMREAMEGMSRVLTVHARAALSAAASGALDLCP